MDLTNILLFCQRPVGIFHPTRWAGFSVEALTKMFISMKGLYKFGSGAQMMDTIINAMTVELSKGVKNEAA